MNIIASLPFEGYQDDEIQKNRKVSVVFGRGKYRRLRFGKKVSLTVHEKNNLIT